jgi:hypothetical protein
VLIGREMSFLRDDGRSFALPMERSPSSGDGCESVPVSGARIVSVAVTDPGRRRVVLTTCEPRVERTPESVGTNAIEVK